MATTCCKSPNIALEADNRCGDLGSLLVDLLVDLPLSVSKLYTGSNVLHCLMSNQYVVPSLVEYLDRVIGDGRFAGFGTALR